MTNLASFKAITLFSSLEGADVLPVGHVVGSSLMFIRRQS